MQLKFYNKYKMSRYFFTEEPFYQLRISIIICNAMQENKIIFD